MRCQGVLASRVPDGAAYFGQSRRTCARHRPTRASSAGGSRARVAPLDHGLELDVFSRPPSGCARSGKILGPDERASVLEALGRRRPGPRTSTSRSRTRARSRSARWRPRAALRRSLSVDPLALGQDRGADDPTVRRASLRRRDRSFLHGPLASLPVRERELPDTARQALELLSSRAWRRSNLARASSGPELHPLREHPC